MPFLGLRLARNLWNYRAMNAVHLAPVPQIVQDGFEPLRRRSNHRPRTDADLLACAHDLLAAS